MAAALCFVAACCLLWCSWSLTAAVEPVCDRLLAASGVATAMVVGSTFLAGTLVPGLRASTLLGLSLAGVAAVEGGRRLARRRRPRPTEPRGSMAERVRASGVIGPIDAALAAPITTVCALVVCAIAARRVVAAVGEPVNDWDGLVRTVPTVDGFVQAGRVVGTSRLLVPDGRLGTTELLITWPAAMLRSTALADLVGVPGALVTSVSAAVIARHLGAGRRWQWWTGLAVAGSLAVAGPLIGASGALVAIGGGSAALALAVSGFVGRCEGPAEDRRGAVRARRISAIGGAVLWAALAAGAFPVVGPGSTWVDVSEQAGSRWERFSFLDDPSLTPPGTVVGVVRGAMPMLVHPLVGERFQRRLVVLDAPVDVQDLRDDIARSGVTRLYVADDGTVARVVNAAGYARLVSGPDASYFDTTSSASVDLARGAVGAGVTRP